MFLRAAVALLSCIVLAACQSVPSSLLPSKLEFGGSPPRAGDDSQVQEDRAADLRDAMVAMGLVRHEQLEKYLNDLLARVRATAGEQAPWARVYLVPGDTPIAETSAVGHIYLSVGWLKLVRSEDELCALVAHEYGHVVLGHHLSDKAEMVVIMARSAYLIGSRLSGHGGGLAGELATEAWLGGVHPSWKRQQEFQADAYAFNALVQAGMSYTEGIKAFLERLGSLEGKASVSAPEAGKTANLGDTHPSAQERLQAVSALYAAKQGLPRFKAKKAEYSAFLNQPSVRQFLGMHAKWAQAQKQLEARKQIQQALKLALQAQQDDVAGHAWVWATVGDLQELNGNQGSAEKAWQASLDAPGFSPRVLTSLSAKLLARRQYKQATMVADVAFKRSSHARPLYPTMVETYRLALEGMPSDDLDGIKMQAAMLELRASCFFRPLYQIACNEAAMNDDERRQRDQALKARNEKLAKDLTDKLKLEDLLKPR